jgi:Uma2 family endonuclease
VIFRSSIATVDTVKKLRLYHRVAIPHYWLGDPRDATRR